MNVRNGILIESGRPGLKTSKINYLSNQKRESKKYQSYIEMQHKLNNGATAVVPFAKHFIKAMEKEGYKVSEYFEIRKKGDETNDASRAEIEETFTAKAH